MLNKVNTSLISDIYLHLFLNFHIWIYADYQVQKEVLQFLVVKTREKPQQIKSLFGVQSCLDVIRLYYHTVLPSSADCEQADRIPELQLQYAKKERGEKDQVLLLLFA